jgi:predicted DNA-binding protein with PD1-like motif
MRIKQLVAKEFERCFAVVLDEGEEATEQLLAFAKTYDVTGATFTGLGAFARATLGFFDLEHKEYRPIPIDEQVELISLVGNFAAEGREPRLHCHVAVSNRLGQAFGGHLLKGFVRPTLEVVVIDSPVHLRRAMDPRRGIPLLVP